MIATGYSFQIPTSLINYIVLKEKENLFAEANKPVE
jgi:hypothetical protein